MGKWVVAGLVVAVLAWYLYMGSGAQATVSGGAGPVASGTGGQIATAGGIPLTTSAPSAGPPPSTGDVVRALTSQGIVPPSGTVIGVSNVGPVTSDGNGGYIAPSPPPGASPIPMQRTVTLAALQRYFTGAPATTSSGTPTTPSVTAPVVKSGTPTVLPLKSVFAGKL